LARDPRVVSFYDAPRKSGGWGATVVELKPRQEGEGDQPSG
jgi:DNA-nicking Smr family endonuclease